VNVYVYTWVWLWVSEWVFLILWFRETWTVCETEIPYRIHQFNEVKHHTQPPDYSRHHVCVCVCERERVCVCVCVTWLFRLSRPDLSPDTSHHAGNITHILILMMREHARLELSQRRRMCSMTRSYVWNDSSISSTVCDNSSANSLA